MLKAIGDKIIVKVDTDETVTKSGIILQGKQERHYSGIVVDVGPAEDAARSGIEVGDWVLYQKGYNFEYEEDKVLYALTLSPEWEKILDDSCQRTELGTMFLLNPVQVQELIETTATTLMRAHQTCGRQPVVLCSPRIRLPLYQLLERHIPTIVVISYSELITDIKVEAIDTIGDAYAQ